MDAENKACFEVDLSDATASRVTVVATALMLVIILERIDRIRSQL